MVSGEVGWGKQRMKRIGIVALARKLLVELWRLLQTGAFPEGTGTKS
jgi:transposase